MDEVEVYGEVKFNTFLFLKFAKNKDFETDDSVENLDLMIARLQKKKEELERKEKFGQWQDLEDAS